MTEGKCLQPGCASSVSRPTGGAEAQRSSTARIPAAISRKYRSGSSGLATSGVMAFCPFSDDLFCDGDRRLDVEEPILLRVQAFRSLTATNGGPRLGRRL